MLSEATYTLSEKLALLAGSISHILPELILSAAFLLMIVFEISIGKKNKKVVPLTGLAGILLSLAAVILLWDSEATVKTLKIEEEPFLGMIRNDGFAGFFKILFAVSGVLTLLFSMQNKKLRSESRGMGEYFIVILGMTIGLHFMSMATNLLMMFLAMEMVSLPSYILTAYARLNQKSAEASIKYVIYGAFSSGIMLFGLSYLYGITGTLDPSSAAFAQNLNAAGAFPVTFVLLLVLGGFAFKISAVPFHFWAPDVYQGASWPVAAFFSVAPKAAGFAMLIRFLDFLPVESNPALKSNLIIVLGLMALVGMTLGNLSALRQENFRRMLAWSSIAHSGYMLLGVACFSLLGNAAVLFYLAVYTVMTYAAFMAAGWLEEQTGSGRFEDYRGLAQGIPLFVILLSILMVSLTGLPPTGGFIGKLDIFLALGEQYQETGYGLLLLLLVAAILNTVVSLFYYLKPPVYMIFKNPSIKVIPRFHGLAAWILAILTIPVLWLGILHFDVLVNFLQGLLLNLSS